MSTVGEEAQAGPSINPGSLIASTEYIDSLTWVVHGDPPGPGTALKLKQETAAEKCYFS